jgi:hypothetical protein
MNFFRNFFANLKADPVSTGKGAVYLAAAAGIGYGMATGAIPVNELSLGTAGSLATGGVHALGSGPVAK